MAEFKLGRIRFIWKDNWTASTTYLKDDVIRYGGRTYVCITGHTATSNFYTDIANWNNFSDGVQWNEDEAKRSCAIISHRVCNGGRGAKADEQDDGGLLRQHAKNENRERRQEF